LKERPKTRGESIRETKKWGFWVLNDLLLKPWAMGKIHPREMNNSKGGKSWTGNQAQCEEQDSSAGQQKGHVKKKKKLGRAIKLKVKTNRGAKRGGGLNWVPGIER